MSYYKYMAIISYDGYDYAGFQAQTGKITIEGKLNEAFKLWLDYDIKIIASGRTDKQVSAYGQVIHFELLKEIKEDGIKKALNSFLPEAIRIKKVEKVSSDFHARFSAKKKEYHYYINISNDDIYNYRYSAKYENLDLDLMNEAIMLFLGTHNFRGLASADIDSRKDGNKTIYEAKMVKKDGLVEFVFVGSGFLKYQVRRMMGLLLDIGEHKKTLEDMKFILESADPKISHRIADGKGLVLYKVYY